MAGGVPEGSVTHASRKLFGTDGVRGVAGEFLTAELATGLGRAAARMSEADTPQVLIVRDTRESGEMLEAALAAGVAAGGGHALLGGVLPTPGASVLVRRYGFDLAAVVSASHNPYEDNGIKFFGPAGTKLGDDEEAAIEALLDRGTGSEAIGRVRDLHGAPGDYLRELESRFSGLRLEGLRVLLDCANGATYRVAPEIFRRLGAEVEAHAVEPDGRNINRDCGSTHVERLAERMGGQDIGFAFDGDGDRVLAVDRNGVVVDGDELMALGALHLRDQGRLAGGGVAVTVMTNYGFHQAMAEHGVEVATTPVGDRHVLVGAAAARLDVRRRAIRAHHRHGLRSRGRRNGRRPAHARGAGRPRPGRARRDGEAPPAAGQRARGRPRRPGRRRGGVGGGGAGIRPPRGPRPRAPALLGHRAARARDGRGAARGRVPRDR